MSATWPIDYYDDDEDCYECGGEGFVLADCFEDTCCCADPEASHGFIVCPVCRAGAQRLPRCGKPRNPADLLFEDAK